MMKVSFAEMDEAWLRSKVENGYYGSISEAVRDMVRKQREIEQSRLLFALEVGEKAIREGRTQPLTRELFKETVKSGIAKAGENKLVVNPDVIQQ